MKIIVDKMPERPENCLFNKEEVWCTIGGICSWLGSTKCGYLKPITDCYAEEKEKKKKVCDSKKKNRTVR